MTHNRCQEPDVHDGPQQAGVGLPGMIDAHRCCEDCLGDASFMDGQTGDCPPSLTYSATAARFAH